MRSDERDELSSGVIRAAISVHRALGPGLLESVYECCLAHELRKGDLRISVGVRVPVIYDGVELDQFFRLDLLVDGG